MRQNTLCFFQKICRSFILIVLSVCIAFTLIFPHPVEASTTPQMRKLTKGKTYTAYDVTGDGKRDTFSYRQGETGYTNFYINGKYISRTWTARGGLVYWARITNGKVFLVVNYSLYGGHGNTILQYQNGKFRPVSGKALEKYNFPFADPSRVAGHSIFFTGSNQRYLPKVFVNNDNDILYATSQFRLTDGSFKLVTRYLTVSGCTTYKVKTGFRCSTSNKTRNTSGIYVPAGASVKITRVFMPTDGLGVWYQISYKNSTGWLYS